jgi:hypothetical protein
MRARGVGAGTAILLIVLSAVTSGWAQELKQDAAAGAPAGGASAGAYPESADGLKKLVEGIFGAVRAKDDAQVSLYFSGLVIPEHGAWFVQTFGAAEGRGWRRSTARCCLGWARISETASNMR